MSCSLSRPAPPSIYPPPEKLSKIRYLAVFRLLLLVWTLGLASSALAQSPPGHVGSVILTRADGSVTASWNAVAGATKYHVTYTTDDGKSWHAPVDDHTNVPTNTLTFSADNTLTYIVGVRAGNDNDQWSGWVNSAGLPPLSQAPPGKPARPSGLTAVAGDRSVTLSWTNPNNSSITRYEYQVNHTDTDTGNLSGWSQWAEIPGSDATTTSYTFGGLTTGKEYRYKIRAVNGEGESEPAPNADPWYISASPYGPPPPPAVTEFWVERICDHHLRVRWKWVDGATGYDLNISLNHRKSWKRLLTNQMAWGYQANHWGVNKTFWFAVRAVNAGGESAWTNVQSIAPPCAVEGLAARYAGNGDIHVNWNPATRADDGYAVNFSADNGKSWQQMTSNLSATAYTFNKDPQALPYNPNFLVAVQSQKGELSSEWRDAPVQAAATLTASNVASATATLTITNWTGQWWYQATAAPHATCQGPVAAGTSTKDLTGLTTGGTYTYTAYSAGGCAEANKLAAAAPFTTGVVSVSNLDETANDTGVGITSAFTEATGFTTGAHGSGYRLRSVTIKAGAATGTPGSFTAAIHAASAGNPAAGPTYTLAGSSPTTAGNHTFTCAGTCQLSDNTTYFLVLSMGGASSNTGAGAASSVDAYIWNVTASDDETNAPSTAGWSIANTAKYQRNVTWTDEADSATGMFRVTATENPALSAGSITTTGATLTIANYAGSWYYKADIGPDTTCQGPVSATTQAVSGLTSNRTYTYSVYSASGCADTSLVTTQAFATGPVSVSNLDEGSHQYGWWIGEQTGANYDAVASAFTTGGATGYYTLSQVTVAFRQGYGNPYNAHAKIYTDASGVPGTLVKDLGGHNPVAAGNYTWTCSGNGCDLSPNTTYHLALETTPRGSGVAQNFFDLDAASSPAETNTPTDAGWTISSTINYRKSGQVWTTYNDTDPLKFKLSALTNPGLAASSVTARTATLTISDHGGSWYYQADAAPHTTCRGPVSATTQALGGLAPSTTYTYTAYSASDCADTSKLATAAAFTTLASGVAVSNLSETARANGIDIIADSPEATGFTTGSHATGYTLQSVIIKTGAAVGTPGSFTAAIHAASAGNPATSATHTLSGDNPTTAGEHTFTCATSQTRTCILSKDTTWFLVLSGTSASYSDGYYVWQMTDSNTQTNTPSTAGWTIADTAKYQRNNAWKDESGFSGLFKVLAEENPLLASGSVTTTEATLTLNHYTGAWWYQRTTPTGDDTCHSVAAGTTTASLSGLTHSTSYTYTTYSAANCNSADEITTATFTTAALGDRDSSKDISNSSSGLSDIWSDGTTVWAAWYIWSLQYGGVLAYDLSTGNRDTSKEFDSRAGNSDSKPFSLWGNASTFYVGDYDDKKIYAYNRSTKARDTSKEFNFHADNAGPWGMWSDGTTLWVSDSSDKKLYAYKLSDGTREAAKDYDTMFSAAGNDAVEGLWSDGVTLWTSDYSDGKVYAYKVSDKSRDTTKDYELDEENTRPTGIWSDGVTMYVADANDQKIYAYYSIDPGAKLSVHYVKTTTATLYVGGHLDAWWYKRTSPSGDTTCHNVAAGTKTAGLSSLTAGTSYTYTAYDKANCNSADELATVTFSTPASGSSQSQAASLAAPTEPYQGTNAPLNPASAFVTRSGLMAGNAANQHGNSARPEAAPGYVSNLLSVRSGDSDIDTTHRQAVRFTTGPNPSGYTLTRFTAALRKLSGPADLILTLHAGTRPPNGADPQPAQTAQATLTGSDPTSDAFTAMPYTCAGAGCQLAPNTTYFVVAASLGPGAYAWATIASAALLTETTEPANSGWAIGPGHYADDSGEWTNWGDWHHARIDFAPSPQ